MIFAGLLLLLVLIGTPLFAVIAASAMLGFASAEIDLSVVAIEIYRLAAREGVCEAWQSARSVRR